MLAPPEARAAIREIATGLAGLLALARGLLEVGAGLRALALLEHRGALGEQADDPLVPEGRLEGAFHDGLLHGDAAGQQHAHHVQPLARVDDLFPLRVVADGVDDEEGVRRSQPGLAGVFIPEHQRAIGEGEHATILGSSGAGKTALLAPLAGLDAPSQGSGEMFGQPPAGLAEDARAGLRAGRVGFVFQDFNLLPRLTAEENIRIGAELGGVEDAAQKTRAALKAVGLEKRARHFPSTLSGGEQQRVAIARAFAPGPELLFADEPTGNLDALNGERIIELLFQLHAEHNTTLVLATHDERLAQRCSRQFILENGRLAD